MMPRWVQWALARLEVCIFAIALVEAIGIMSVRLADKAWTALRRKR